ncbi:hypothetical protein SO802_010945 [Lithocarpus litseifolius]|uniref:RNase H type-1 domain-containing protein n=1 Tax=Lithocarpus litseifolius TaxID=425828 RepID=A0AAW2DIL9_9ROSI
MRTIFLSHEIVKEFAAEPGLHRLIFERDLAIVINAVSQGNAALASYGNIVENIRCFVSSFQFFDFIHVHRTGNLVADALAKKAKNIVSCQVWFRAKFENMGSMDIFRFLICIILLITLIKLTTDNRCESCQSTKGVCTTNSSGDFACLCNGEEYELLTGVASATLYSLAMTCFYEMLMKLVSRSRAELEFSVDEDKVKSPTKDLPEVRRWNYAHKPAVNRGHKMAALMPWWT